MEGARARRNPSTKDTTLHRRTGIVIIGGGVIGLSIGYYLAALKRSDVLIVEREAELAQHASGHNAGEISPPRVSHQRGIWQLHKEGLRLFEQLSRTKGFDFDYNVNGLTVLNNKGFNEEAAQTTASRLHEETGIDVRFLSCAELQELEPNISTKDVCSAIFYPDGAQGNSKKLTLCFADACSKRGVEIMTETQVLQVKAEGKRITEVKTDRGSIFPEVLVIAAGPWSGQVASLLGLSFPIEPAKGHLITTEPARNRPLRSFVFGPEYYVTQIPSGEFVVGGGIDFVGFDESVDESKIKGAWEEGLSILPSLRALKQQSKASCFRPYAPGGLPVIGRGGRYSNLVFATGHHTSGFALSPITGMLVAELITKDETRMMTVDISRFSPTRYGL